MSANLIDNNKNNIKMSVLSILNKLFGNKSQRDLREIQPIVDQINALGPDMKKLSNDELR